MHTLGIQTSSSFYRKNKKTSSSFKWNYLTYQNNNNNWTSFYTKIQFFVSKLAPLSNKNKQGIETKVLVANSVK